MESRVATDPDSGCSAVVRLLTKTISSERARDQGRGAAWYRWFAWRTFATPAELVERKISFEAVMLGMAAFCMRIPSVRGRGCYDRRRR